VEPDNSKLYPHAVLDMGVHPHLFLVAPLPGSPRYSGREKDEAKWHVIHSSPMTITSQLCLLPVSAQGEQPPVTLHADESSLFYVDAAVNEKHGQRGDSFDSIDKNLLCFEEVTFAANFNNMRSSCRQRAGTTPPHTCYASARLPSQFYLKFDSQREHIFRSYALRLHSRVLYKAVVLLSLTIARAQGEATVIDLVSPVFFTAFRQKINFAYLVQAEGKFDTTHLETPYSLSLVSQWRHSSAQLNSFYLPNRSPN
jgi:hypothetical protein